MTNGTVQSEIYMTRNYQECYLTILVDYGQGHVAYLTRMMWSKYIWSTTR